MSESEDALAALMREVVPMIRLLHVAISELPIPDEIRAELTLQCEAMDQAVQNGRPHTWGM